jgi:hypothetical protein
VASILTAFSITEQVDSSTPTFTAGLKLKKKLASLSLYVACHITELKSSYPDAFKHRIVVGTPEAKADREPTDGFFDGLEGACNSTMSWRKLEDGGT